MLTLWFNLETDFFHEKIGMTGFEPATPSSQARCATKLRYIPIIIFNFQFVVRTTHLPKALRFRLRALHTFATRLHSPSAVALGSFDSGALHPNIDVFNVLKNYIINKK